MLPDQTLQPTQMGFVNVCFDCQTRNQAHISLKYRVKCMNGFKLVMERHSSLIIVEGANWVSLNVSSRSNLPKVRCHDTSSAHVTGQHGDSH